MKCANCYDTVAAMLAAKDKVIAEVTADRDEWKYQHELLLGVRNADLAALRAKLTSQVASGEAVAWKFQFPLDDVKTNNICAMVAEDPECISLLKRDDLPNLIKEPLYLHPPTPSPSNVLVEALREITYSHDGYARKKAEQALATYSASTDSVSVLLPSYSHASNCYVCPYCSCGCMPDWEKTHLLRCTGCKRGFTGTSGLSLSSIDTARKSS